MTQVADVMTGGVRTLSPDNTIVEAAQAMQELDVGAIPICQGNQVVGVVTDRDIVIRAIAQNRPVGSTLLRDVMSTQVKCIYEDDDLDEVTAKMQQSQIRRLPVLDREGKLIGMLSLGDLAAKVGSDHAAEALVDISKPARPARAVEMSRGTQG